MAGIPHGTLVLAADGARMLILRNNGLAHAPQFEVIEHGAEHHPPARALGSDRPGRANDALGRKSAMDETDWHAEAEVEFLTKAAAAFGRHAAGDMPLIVAAPPRALAQLRKVLPDALQSRIFAEINKDLNGMPIADIGKALLAAAG